VAATPGFLSIPRGLSGGLRRQGRRGASFALALAAVSATFSLAASVPKAAAALSPLQVVIGGPSQTAVFDAQSHSASPLSETGTAGAISPDGKTLYITSTSPDSLEAVNLSSGTVVSSDAVTGVPTAVAVSPDGSTAYVVTTSGRVTAITTSPTLTTAWTVHLTTSNLQSVVVSPDGQTLYVAAYGSGVDAVATTGSHTVTTLLHESEALQLGLSPDGQHLWVGGDSSNDAVPVINTATHAVTDVSVPGDPAAAVVSPDGSTAAVRLHDSDDDNDNGDQAVVVFVNTSTDHITSTVALGPEQDGLGGDGFAYNPAGTELWTTLDNVAPAPTAALLELAGSTVTDLSTVTGADWVAYTPDQAPTAALTVTPAAPGQPTTLDASASTGSTSPIASYSWNFGDTSTTTTSTPVVQHTYAAPGSYTASVTVTDVEGTSTAIVSNGVDLDRKGGPSATTSQTFNVASTNVTASLTTSSPTVASVQTVPEDSLPAAAVESGASSNGPGNSASAPLHSIPLHSIPLGSIPLHSIPLGSIPLHSIPLAAQALSTAALSDIGVTYPSGCTGSACTGWPGILAGTSLAIDPLQSTTLAQVLADPTASSRFDTLQLSDLDLSSSPLGSIPLASIALAGVPLASIPLPGSGNTPTSVLTAWCSTLSGLGYDCSTDFGIDPSNPSTATDVSLLALSLAGVPLHSIPLASIPLHSIDLSASPLASIPLHSIALAGTPLGSIPLGSIPLHSIPLGSIPLHSIPLHSIPLGSIPLDAFPLHSIPLGSIPLHSIPLHSIPLGSIALTDVPPGVVDCSGASNGFTCPAGSTLGDALDAGAILPGATLADLSTYDGTTLADVAGFDTTTTLAELGVFGLGTSGLSALPLHSIPLGSIPLGSIPLASIPLHSIPLGSIPLHSIPLHSIPLGSIALSSLPDLAAVVDCSGAQNGFTCPAGSTLDDALNAGAILPGATLADLGTYNGTTLAQLGFYGSVLLSDLGATLSAEGVSQLAQFEQAILSQLGDLSSYGDTTTIEELLADLDLSVPNVPNLTLSDLLLSLMPPSSYAWNGLNLSDVPLAQYESAGGNVEYQTSLEVTGSAGPVSVALTLPAGFAYVAGSSTLDSSPTADPIVTGSDSTGATLTWNENLGVGPHSLVATADAGTPLGSAAASLTASTTTSTSSSGASVQVVDGTEPDNTPATATPLATGDEELGNGYLNVGYLTSSTDINLWSVSVAQGDELALSLSNLPADYDFVLYAPTAQQLQGPPAQQAPGVSDAPPSLTPVDEPSVGGNDVPLQAPPGYQVYSESATRGTADESIQTPPLDAGTYYVQVSGYNGADGAQPYILRGTLLPTGANSCPGGISYPNPMPAPAAAPSSYPANVNTLFLVDTQRLAAAYGTAAEGQVLSALNTVAADNADGVVGAVVPVDSDQATQNAFNTFNQDPCNVASANGVVAAVSSLVDSIRATHPTVRNLVIVGADDQIPFARIADGTTQSNERDYGTSTFAGENNVEADALSEGYYFSDDPYAASTPLNVGTTTLYLPQLAVGRLVETPTEIVSALNRFVSSHGVLDASAALSTGYSFLSSGAQLVATNLAKVSGRSVATLINETWTHQQLDQALTASPTPGLDSVNAHFDYSRALPAAGNTDGNQTDLFTTQDIRSAPTNAYAGRLLFSMGCHSGLDVNDFEVAASGVTTPVDDWAKTFADSGALWVGNTGFGYGDTATVAYSAKLMAGFADHLDGSESVGTALSDAKQAYAAGGAVLSPYDMKALMESTLYGLPMYRLNSTPPSPTPPPTPPALGTDPVTGLTSASLSVDLTQGSGPGQLSEETDSLGHHYFQVNGDNANDPGLQATENRPFEPEVSLNVGEPASGNPDTLGVVAHGALVTSLTSNDVTGFTPALSEPGVDTSAGTFVQPLGDSPFPSQLQRVASSEQLDLGTGVEAQGQQVDFVAGQFLPNPNQPGQGTQRLFGSAQLEVLYTQPSDQNDTPPTIQSTQGYEIGGVTDFVVNVLPSASPVKRVLVLYTDAANPGTWTPEDLVTQNGTTWTGAGPGTASGTVDYLVQAVDGDGNVGVSTNKGAYFPAVSPPASSPAITITVSGATLVDGYYNGAVSATVTGPAGLTYSLDGSASTPVTGPIGVAGDGTHLLTATDAAGDAANQVVRIDTQPPVIHTSVSPPPGPSGWIQGGTVVSIVAADAGSGVASLSYSESGAQQQGPTNVNGTSATVPVTTSGVTVVTVNATDNVGNASSTQVTVKIDNTPPTVSCGAADGNWHAADVPILCTASDGGSGLANPAQASFSLTTSVPSGTETANASTNSVQVCDAVGNCTTAGPVTGNMVDKKPPTLTVGTSPSPVGGWLPGGATLNASATDGGSGLATITYSATGAQATGPTTVHGSTISVPLTVSGVSTFTVTATDNVGNATTTEVPVQVDATPPAISCGSPDGNWHATDVSIPCTASDGGSGLANPAQASFSLTTSVPSGTETANASTNSVVVCDVVGNCATAGPISGIKVDKKAPTITISQPTSGGAFTVGQVVTVAYQCSDGGSGVATCTGTQPNGAALATSTPGTYSFTVNATDQVGNASTMTVTYTVADGICQPVQPIQVLWTVTFTVELCNAQGKNITTAGATVTAVTVDGKTKPVSFFPDPTNRFLFVPIVKIDLYTLDASHLSVGTHTLQISVAGDPVVHSITFTLHK